MNDYFTFEDAEQAFVIKRHDAPSAWINYLSNGQMHAFVSQAGGGFAWWRSPSHLRLTRYRQHNQPYDSPGFYVYVRPEKGSAWSPTLRPCEVELEQWEGRHLPGRSYFEGEKDGLKASVEYFVTPDHDVVAWDVNVTNTGQTEQTVDLFGYVEFSQYDWVSEAGWGYYQRHMLKSWFDEDSESVQYLYRNFYAANHRKHPLAWLACSEPVQSWSGHRDDFLGAYGSEREPRGVRENHCGNKHVECGDACGALQNRITLKPGESKRLAFYMGATPGVMQDFEPAIARTSETIAKLKDLSQLDAQKEKLKHWWSEHLDIFQAEIPDVVSERQINIWTPVNTVHTGRYSRAVNNLAPGIRGVGYRDTAQDMLSVAYRKPEWATQEFLYLLSQQFEDGHAVHTAFPETGDKPSTSLHSDDHLWLPMLAHAILAETGDFSLLDREVSWLTEDASSQTSNTSSVWEHLLAAVQFTEDHLGAHDIPLTLASDWNDIIGRFAREGRGESVFAGQQYAYVLNLLISIAEAKGDGEKLAWLKDCRTRQEAALLKCAWDGQWWRRGFDDDGLPVGSAESSFGNLFLNPQSWAILAGVGNREQHISGMDAVAAQLDTGIGLKILHPGFKTYPDVHDPFSGYGPGCGENGAIFCHANTWAVIAEALLGRPERAWKYYTQLIAENVINKVGMETYAAEPYAWVSNIVGPENNRSGWANVTQVTGTATWMDVASTQYLLGIRPEMNGLKIDPCLPEDWKEVKVKRRYAGKLLDIQIEQSDGEYAVTVNGEVCADRCICREATEDLAGV